MLLVSKPGGSPSRGSGCASMTSGSVLIRCARTGVPKKSTCATCASIGVMVSLPGLHPRGRGDLLRPEPVGVRLREGLVLVLVLRQVEGPGHRHLLAHEDVRLVG